MTTQIKGDATSTFGSDIDITGNVITDAPALKVTLSANQTIANNTATKITFDSVDFDLTSDYDNTTNYRFTPSVAGYYLVTGMVYFSAIANATSAYINVRKNGTEVQRGTRVYQGSTAAYSSIVDGVFYMNGSTDYLEAYCRHNHGSSRDINSADYVSNFSVVLLRAT